MNIQHDNSDFTNVNPADAGGGALPKYLNTLFGDYPGSLPFDLNGELIQINDLSEIPDGARALPANQDGLFFCIGLMEEAERDDYATCTNEPSLAVFNAEKKLMLLIYALDHPEQDGAMVDRLLDIFEMDPNEGIPLPGQDGWDVVHPSEQLYTAQDLLQRLSGVAEGISLTEGIEIPDEAEVAPEPAVDESKKFYDAVIRTSFTPEGYEGKTITVSLGDNSKSMNWVPREIPLLDLLMMLSRHQIGKKDGKSFVFADMVEGQRLKNAVKGVTAIALDVDNGIPTEQIDAALKKLNCLAVRYTTHSHFKTESEFKRDEILRFEPEALEITTEVVRRYLLRKKHWYEPLVETAEYLDEVHESSGIMIKVKHAPMHKNRIVVPLRDPFVIAQEGKTQMEAMAKWAKYPRALSDLLKIPYDPACTDPSRVFFPPRHDKSRPFSASIFGGPLFDRQALQLGNSFDALAEIAKKMGGKSHTEEGKALGKWSTRFAHGCQIVDIIQEYCPGKIRGPASLGSNIECPFDAGHSNSGDEGDRACWTVNAAQGGNELPIVSCRHGTCENYTFLDMIGKMVKDEWFPREALEDLAFNILKFTEEQGKEKARSEYEKKRDALNPDSSGAEIDVAFELLVQAALAELDEESEFNKIKKLTKKSKGKLGHSHERAKRKYRKETESQVNYDPNGPAVFRYEAIGRDFHAAWKFCRDAMLSRNTELGYPKFCHVEGVPAILDVEHKDGLRLQLVDIKDDLWSMLNTLVVFVRKTENGDSPPDCVEEKVAKHLFHRIAEMVPAAPKVSDTPCFLPNGDLVIEPGYKWNPERGLNHYIRYKSGEVFNVPDKVTIKHVRESVKWWRNYLLCDFAFADQNEGGDEDPQIGFANTLAMFLTPFALPMIDAKSPMFLFTKSSPDEGATLVVETLGTIVEGAEPQIMDYGTDDEMRKAQLAAAMEGRKIFFYDDVTSANSKALHRKLTSDTISDRVLGKSQTVSVKNRVLWAGTGINVEIGQETAKRSVIIYLDSHCPDPGKRDFYHPAVSGIGFKDFVEQNRALAVSHLLTIIEYWVQLKMPKDKTAKCPAYDEWVWNVGGILKEAEVKGFMGQREAKAPNPELAAQKEFLKATIDAFGMEGKTGFVTLFNHHVERGSAFLNGVRDHEQEKRFKEFVARLNKKTVEIGKGKEKRSLRLVRYLDPDTGEQTFSVENAPERKTNNAG